MCDFQTSLEENLSHALLRMTQVVKSRLRWGDTLDEDDVLPPSTLRGPDEHGHKWITEYYRNDKGDSFKRTQKIKVLTVDKKVYKVRYGHLAFHGDL